MKEYRKMNIAFALIPVLTLIASLIVCLRYLGTGPHIPIVFSAAVAAAVAIAAGFKWEEIEKYIIETMGNSLQAIAILLVVGILIGTWILAGVVPSMIYYGLLIISPKVFLIVACVLSAIVSIATGSSWGTVGTIGIALIGIGETMGIPLPMVAGAIISGAYFGDKMSPLSDTTNLAPAMAGSELFEHIKHMVYTVGPSILISLVLYGILGIKYGSSTLDGSNIEIILNGLSSNFVINPILLVPPVMVIIMVIKKVPALPGLFLGALLAAVLAMAIQKASLDDVVNVAHYGFSSDTGIAVIDKLLNRGGMSSMSWTISLILVAMAFGGILEKTGMLHVMIEKILARANSTGSLVLSTVLTCLAINILTASQYLSIIITGSMFKERYAEQGLHPKNLSRVLEDSGTVISPLIPWNNCGAFMASTLGVATLAYLPYAFLCYINPIISVIYGYTGLTIEKLGNDEVETESI
ncbi:Na+:H+ antiporter, NhaC family [Dethiosulfatibacter aminovorans DSM 17477]|uniref:Na+:H+ antiporter, NhaC family n=1 Tax=Dethiosulfatibacter aminovorans DSM 17477 TaxID=1121476 RepID=A0A1M6A850_9FIRM|nr:Na+/H+ antiporter NhaC [Dethiosulfatibacter aminovorans]SHI32630.1 Na+:H+ antiporter, NhaC family [Dethiosulfatibacter aminovorans DSM 17477]